MAFFRERESTGIKLLFTSRWTKGRFVGLEATTSPLQTLWSLLESYYQIDSKRDRLLLSKGIHDLEMRAMLGETFSAYMLQAKNFYDYACNSDFRSAPLLYYYSFLNMARAKIVIERPMFFGKEFTHGMKAEHSSNLFENQSIRIHGSLDLRRRINPMERIPTLPMLYRLRFGKNIPKGTVLELQNLLSYCSDINHEMQTTINIPAATNAVRIGVGFRDKGQPVPIRLAIHGDANLIRHPRTYAKFKRKFSSISMDKEMIDKFSIPIGALENWHFFESDEKITYNEDYRKVLNKAHLYLDDTIGNAYQTDVYDMNNSCNFTAGINDDRIAMDELMAIFITMFHYSSLVRYKPEQMRNVLSSTTETGWLGKSFVEQAPQTFYIRMAGWIIGEQFFVKQR
jgi:hypothetical protein